MHMKRRLFHQSDLATGHREINEPHCTAALHVSDNSTTRTSHQLTHEFNVNLGNRRLVVDSEHPDSLEVDEE
jgi:glucose dehydrogenase